MVTLPYDVKLIIQNVIRAEITQAQLRLQYLKLVRADYSDNKKIFWRYNSLVQKWRKKLAKLHEISHTLKYPIWKYGSVVLLNKSQLQTILSILRLDAKNRYLYLRITNRNIADKDKLCIKDGTLANKIEFMHLNIYKNKYRKVLIIVKDLELAIRCVKKLLNHNTNIVKKPLSFKRKIRQIMYNIWGNV